MQKKVSKLANDEVKACPLCHGWKTQYCDDHPDKPCWLTNEPKFIPYTGPIKDTQLRWEQPAFSPRLDLMLQTTEPFSKDDFEENKRRLEQEISLGSTILTPNEMRVTQFGYDENGRWVPMRSAPTIDLDSPSFSTKVIDAAGSGVFGYDKDGRWTALRPAIRLEEPHLTNFMP